MIPDIIDGKYRVIREIGSGGMARVYRAINLSTRKVVAVKMLKEEYLNDTEFLRRFDREARASLELSHENIVRAYGVGPEITANIRDAARSVSDRIIVEAAGNICIKNIAEYIGKADVVVLDRVSSESETVRFTLDLA